MKLGVYFRESWHNLLADKTYGLVYILAVAFSMAMVMTYLTVQAVRMDNSYPEVHRDRMLSIPSMTFSAGQSVRDRGVNKDFMRRFLSGPISGLEAWTAVKTDNFIVSTTSGESVNMAVEFIGSGFRTIFPLDVIDGAWLSEDAADRAVPEVMISESAAVLLLGRKDVVGETVFFDSREFRICGVVRDVPMTATYAFAQIWAPDIETFFERLVAPALGGMQGSYEIVLLAGSRRDFGRVRQEIEDRVERYNRSGGDDWKMTFTNGIPSQKERIFMFGSASAYRWIGLGVVLLVLLVPVLNLSGMTGSGMEARMAEFGVRKSFGAWRGAIVRQVTTENLLLTLIGGVLGLLLSYLLLYLLQDQLYDLLPLNGVADIRGIAEAPAFAFRDFFRLRLYLLLFVLVAALNLLSAMAPALKVLHRPITESLNSQK